MISHPSDRQTDGRTDGTAIAYTRHGLALVASQTNKRTEFMFISDTTAIVLFCCETSLMSAMTRGYLTTETTSDSQK